MELTDEEMEALSGGGGTVWDEIFSQCPHYFGF